MGGELWGTYDEREAARSFKEAVREWRGGDETTSSASSLSVAYATSASNAALRPSDAGWGQSPQCCWECLTRFTDRGHWSVLARRQVCGKACAATYEKARRLEPPPPAPPRRRAACQRCFNLCDPDAAVPAAGGGVFCAAACAVAAGAATPAPPTGPAPPSGARGDARLARKSKRAGPPRRRRRLARRGRAPSAADRWTFFGAPSGWSSRGWGVGCAAGERARRRRWPNPRLRRRDARERVRRRATGTVEDRTLRLGREYTARC